MKFFHIREKPGLESYLIYLESVCIGGFLLIREIVTIDCLKSLNVQINCTIRHSGNG